MSIETIDPPGPSDKERLDSQIEALIDYRRELQAKLNILSVNLCNITQKHNECINEIIVTNAWLAARGVDTQALAREIQAHVVHPASL
jgi:hypothetical protein